MLIFIGILILIFIYRVNPYIDITNEGFICIWYTELFSGKRKYIKLK